MSIYNPGDRVHFEDPDYCVPAAREGDGTVIDTAGCRGAWVCADADGESYYYFDRELAPINPSPVPAGAREKLAGMRQYVADRITRENELSTNYMRRNQLGDLEQSQGRRLVWLDVLEHLNDAIDGWVERGEDTAS